MATRTKATRRAAKNGACTIAEEVRAELGEASAIVPLGGRRFLVADDEGGVRLVDASSGPRSKREARVEVLLDAGDDDRVAGLEGMCAAGAVVLAVREGDGHVVSFAPPAANRKGTLRLEDVGVLERPPSSPGKKNKGYEGLAFLPARAAFDKREHVVAVHEGKPRALCVFAWPSLALEHSIAVDDDASRTSATSRCTRRPVSSGC